MIGSARSWLLVVALATLALLAGCSSPARQDGSGPSSRRTDDVVSGTVTAEQGSTWTVRSGATTHTVLLTPQTAFGTPRQPQAATAFPVGATVRVHGTTSGTTITARRITPPLRGTKPGGSSSPRPSPSAPPPPPVPASPLPADASAPVNVAAAVAAADAVADQHVGTTLGVAVAAGTGGPVTLGADGAQTFEMASVVKLYTIVDILHRSENGEALTDADRQDIQAALTASDDGAMDDLWERWGDVETVDDIVDLAHLQDTAPPSDTGQWGETTSSPRDVLAVYRYALTSLNSQDQAMVFGALGNAASEGTDGFDQSFGLLASPRPTGVEAKQGWMQDGPLFLHTTGRPDATSPYLVAILSEQPGVDSWDTARSTVDAATHALVTDLAAPPT